MWLRACCSSGAVLGPALMLALPWLRAAARPADVLLYNCLANTAAHKQQSFFRQVSMHQPGQPIHPLFSASHLRRTSEMRMSVHRGDDAGDAFIGVLSGALGAELGKQDAQSRESEFGHYAGRGKNLTAHQKRTTTFRSQLSRCARLGLEVGAVCSYPEAVSSLRAARHAGGRIHGRSASRPDRWETR